MLELQIIFARSARKDLQALSYDRAERILKKIDGLKSEPRPSGCTKLKGYPNLWRIRVGEYRVIYSIDDDKRIIDISVVRHRNDAYR